MKFVYGKVEEYPCVALRNAVIRDGLEASPPLHLDGLRTSNRSPDFLGEVPQPSREETCFREGAVVPGFSRCSQVEPLGGGEDQARACFP